MAGGYRRVTWTLQAQSALDEVLAYIARESPQGAATILSEALSAAGQLSTLADRGRVVPECDDPAVREVFVRKYRLMYETSENEVRVLAFIHGARDFARWRKRK